MSNDTALVPIESGSITTHDPAVIAAMEDLADPNGNGVRYLEAAKSAATRKAYVSDWRCFIRWIADNYGKQYPEPDEHDRVKLTEPVHPVFVLRYIEDQASELRHSTISRRLSAIRHWHKFNRLASPTDEDDVSTVMDGIRNEHKYRKDQATPLYLADLRAAVQSLGDSPKDIRDRALLLLGWWTASRRSELVGLDVPDISNHPEGLEVYIAESKTDQAGEGMTKYVHYRSDPNLCPVRAVRAWLNLAGIESGPVFRRVDRWGNVKGGRLSGEAVSTIVKETAARVGLDETDYSAHSLRRGFVSECDSRGVPNAAVRATTGHASDAMLSVYSRPREGFAGSATAYFDDLDAEKPLDAHDRRAEDIADKASRR